MHVGILQCFVMAGIFLPVIKCDGPLCKLLTIYRDYFDFESIVSRWQSNSMHVPSPASNPFIIIIGHVITRGQLIEPILSVCN